jgi:membrane protease YdiL (CAAX protease family)
MNLFDILLLYDESLPAPTITEILIWTGVILVVSNVIFIAICALFGVDSSETLDKEKDKEYVEWSKNGVSPWAVASSEILNSSIYSPIAEELAFRVLLLKILCVRGLKLDFWVSNFIQASIFGTMHLSNVTFTTQTKNYTYLQAISAGISGLVSGFVYKQSNSILPSLIAHVLNNASAGMSEVIGYVKYRGKN